MKSGRRGDSKGQAAHRKVFAAQQCVYSVVQRGGLVEENMGVRDDLVDLSLREEWVQKRVGVRSAHLLVMLPDLRLRRQLGTKDEKGKSFGIQVSGAPVSRRRG